MKKIDSSTAFGIMLVKNKNYTFFYIKGFNSDHLKNRIRFLNEPKV